MRSLCVFPPQNMHVWLPGYSKLPIGVNVLPLRQPVPRVPPFSACDSERLQAKHVKLPAVTDPRE